jgi:hypothetical protein
MRQRGRKSGVALQLVASGTGHISVVQRPDPPDDMTNAEALIWRVTVDSMPADWFRPEQLPVLKQYCRHVATADQIATWKQEAERRMLEDTDAANFDMWVCTLDRLLKLQAHESRSIAALATKMRLTQQSTCDKSVKKPLMGKKPWESE